MSLTKEALEFHIVLAVTQVVETLSTDMKMSPEDALRFFMKTKTFDELQDKKSKLFLESHGYVMDMLGAELRGDWESWLTY